MAEAVGQTQIAVSVVGERVHLLEVARGLSGDTGTAANSPDGRWGSSERAGLEATALRQRLNKLELRVHASETTAAEPKAERYAAERDFCNGLSKLDSQIGSTTTALGEALTGLMQEVLLQQVAKAEIIQFCKL